MSGLEELSAGGLRSGYLNRSFSPVEVVQALADRIARTESTVHSFTTLVLDEALAAAASAEAAYRAGRARPLEGIPFAAKDLFDTRGIRTTYGSAMFRDHVPGRDAEAVSRLLRAGSILVGKTATHEFAWGITTVNEAMGSTFNPWDPTRITGGSSGGSAAAVAAHEVPVALASDTGGSIRIPAAFCGVVGFKPSFGLVSTAGVFPLAPSLDHAGLMVRDPADLPALMQVLVGGDEQRSSVGRRRLRAERGNHPPRRWRVGLCSDLQTVRLGAAARLAFDAAARTWGDLGARLVEVSFHGSGAIEDAFGWTQRAEALDTHQTRNLFPTRGSEYGPDVRARLEAATEVTLAMYLEAQRRRGVIRAEFQRLFNEVDMLLTPITPIAPPPHGQDLIRHFGHDSTLRGLVMPFVVPQDLAGLPAVAVRAGMDSAGLPVGIQFCGPVGSDERVLAMAREFYEATSALQATWPQPSQAVPATDG